MNNAEFLKIAEMIKTAYPKDKLLPNKAAMDLWYLMLKDITYKQAQTSVLSYIATHKFPPTIADIREAAADVTGKAVSDWGAGWAATLKVIRNYGWCRQAEAMAELDDITRQTVRRLGYMELCTSENLMADRGNFRMIYEELAARENDKQKTPEGLRLRIETERRAIDEAGNTKLVE